MLQKRQDELAKSHKKQVEQLEAISKLSAEEAKEQLVEALKDEAKTKALEIVQSTIEEAKLTANQGS